MSDRMNHQAGGDLSIPSASLNVSRRGFAAMGAAVAAAAGVGTAKAATPTALRKSREVIATPLGNADTYFVRPTSGQHEAVVLWAPGGEKRDANVAVADYLAEQGFAVLMVDRSYHDLAPGQIGGLHVDQLANRDARALVAWLNRQDGVQPSSESTAGPAALGHGYTLRTISAAHPRMSLANRSERQVAALSGMMVAIPTAGVARRPDRMEKLSQAVRLAHRAGIAA